MRTLMLVPVMCLLTFGCGGGDAAPPATPSTSAPSATPKPAADAGGGGGAAGGGGGVNPAALEKLTAEEAKSGTCDAEHKAALEKLLDDVETHVRASKTEDGKPLKVESFTKRVMALAESAKGVELTLTGKGTQVHVISWSSKEVSLDVLAGKEAASTMRSTYAKEVTGGGPAKLTLPKVGGAVELQYDSRQVEMKVGTPLAVKMRGQGCAGVVVFSKS